MDLSQEFLTELTTLLPAPYPPSILVPRSHARRLVDMCELMEMMNLPLDFACGSNGGGNGGSNGQNENGGTSSKISPYVLVIEMSLLIYLGEYTHARHLWRRCRRAPTSFASTATLASAKSEVNSPMTMKTENDDVYEEMSYAQLELLWNVARYCYLWSTGGIYSLGSDIISTVGTGTSKSSASDPMQVEESTKSINDSANDAEDESNLPFSTLALRALQQCHDSKMEPLSTYSSDLTRVFRYKVNEELHRSFGRLKWEEFCLRMNFDLEEVGGVCVKKGKGEEVLDAYGWVIDSTVASTDAGHGNSSSIYVTPDPEWDPHYQDYVTMDLATHLQYKHLYENDLAHDVSRHDDVVVHNLFSNEDRIRRLTDVVMFMEQSRMNA